MRGRHERFTEPSARVDKAAAFDRRDILEFHNSSSEALGDHSITDALMNRLHNDFNATKLGRFERML